MIDDITQIDTQTPEADDECRLCGCGDAQTEDHHISYDPEETITVCVQCHADIHHTDDYPDLRPDDDDVSEFYGRNLPIDTSAIPSRPGCSIQIKTTQCSKSNCENCPHGPYYYYVKRTHEGVDWEYGGKVTPAMYIEQASLDEYV